MAITPATYFRIRGRNPDTSWYTWRDDTWPKPQDRTPQLILPRPTALNPVGKPIGAFGKPVALIRFPWIRANGNDTSQYLYDPSWDDILALYTAASYPAEYREVDVEMRDIRTQAWKVYHGYAKFPILPDGEATVILNDGTMWYKDAIIEVVSLTEAV